MVLQKPSLNALRNMIYDALEQSSYRTVYDLACCLDSGTPATQVEVRAVLRSEPEVFWQDEDYWDLAVFHSLIEGRYQFQRKGRGGFNRNKFIQTVLVEALRLKGAPVERETLAEKYLLKIAKNAEIREFPRGKGPILHVLDEFINSTDKFAQIEHEGIIYLWTDKAWPEPRQSFPQSAYTLPGTFLNQAADFLETRRDQPVRLLEILQSVLNINANHSDFSAAFSQANNVLALDTQTFVQVQRQSWMLSVYLPTFIEEIPARVAIPRWRNPTEEKLIDSAYALTEGDLGETAGFAKEDEKEAAEAHFDESVLHELRFVLPYHWRQNGVLKVNARERCIFVDRPARVRLTFEDNLGQSFPVWLNNDTGYLYGLKDWFAENLVPAGGVFYLQRATGSLYDFKIWTKNADPHTFDGKQYACEIEPDTYIEESRLRDLEALRLKVETAQATIKDVLCDIFGSYPLNTPVHYRQLWAQVHVIRPTTRRTVAAILSMFPCFFQSEANTGEWFYAPELRDTPPKRYHRRAQAPKPVTRKLEPHLPQYWLVSVSVPTWAELARSNDAAPGVALVPWRGRASVIKGDQVSFYHPSSGKILSAVEVLRAPVADPSTGQRELAVRPLLPIFVPLNFDEVASGLSVPRPDAFDNQASVPVELTSDDFELIVGRLKPLVAPAVIEPTLETLIEQYQSQAESSVEGEIITHTYGPNPTIPIFIARYGKSYNPEDQYERVAFTQPIKAGKNTAIYNAHSYHTKVPPQGIEPYIAHYTNPGDIVLDPFCGSGMTGVAALKLGRRVILNDLSPAATHIAYNYCTPVNVDILREAFEKIKTSLTDEFNWLYGTTCDRCGGPATIQYTIWSDVYECGKCHGEIILWEAAVESQTGEVKTEFYCPYCSSMWQKNKLKRLRSEPVITNYECPRCKPKRSEHEVTEAEKSLLSEINARDITYWYPTINIDRDLDLWYERDYRKLDIYTVDKFYTKRNLWALSRLWYDINQIVDNRIKRMFQFIFTSISNAMTKMYRYRASRKGGIIEGTLYVPSFFQEMNVLMSFSGKLRSFCNLFTEMIGNKNDVIIETTSTTSLDSIPSETIDYIFTDPPFGSNIIYSDLSILWESWLGQFTQTTLEAVIHRRKKGNPNTLNIYTTLMRRAFAEMYRTLKPGRWASVIFHNTDDRVWRAIQQAVLDVGFDLVNALAFDKEQASFKQVTAEGAANFDIVLNLNKPLREAMVIETRPSEDIRNFVMERVDAFLQSGPPPEYRSTKYIHSQMLRQLLNGNLIIERITIPYLEKVLPTRFRKVNDRWYLQRESVTPSGYGILVRSEPAAVAWLEHVLSSNPQSLSDLIPQWQIATLGAGSQINRPLQDILHENFWQDEVTGLWCMPTAAQREILKRRKSKPRQLELGLDMGKSPQMDLGFKK